MIMKKLEAYSRLKDKESQINYSQQNLVKMKILIMILIAAIWRRRGAPNVDTWKGDTFSNEGKITFICDSLGS